MRASRVIVLAFVLALTLFGGSSIGNAETSPLALQTQLTSTTP